MKDMNGWQALKNRLQFPVTVYQKENGYLGLISYDYYNDDLFFTTKSTPNGDYAVHFKNLFKFMFFIKISGG